MGAPRPSFSGETKVSSANVCTGGVRWTPADNRNDDPRFYWHLNSNPDNVTIPYNVSWEDARNTFPVPPTAYHNFTLDAVHLSDPVRHDEKRVQTNGGVSETHWVLSVTATNVYSLQWVNVTFTASLHLQGGSGCPIDDSVTMYYKFVYP